MLRNNSAAWPFDNLLVLHRISKRRIITSRVRSIYATGLCTKANLQLLSQHYAVTEE
jgi:hypothetical protein